MILKIRAPRTEQLEGVPKSGWIIRSGIKEIKYFFERVNEDTNYTFEAVATMGCDRCFRAGVLTSKQILEQTSNEKCTRWTQIVVTFVDGSIEEWLLEVEAYLLNDDGKTIEKIC